MGLVYQRSEDIADLNELYKQLHDFSCHDETRKTNPELCYNGVSEERITEEIKHLEYKIYQDCFENFYPLMIDGYIELIESYQHD